MAFFSYNTDWCQEHGLTKTVAMIINSQSSLGTGCDVAARVVNWRWARRVGTQKTCPQTATCECYRGDKLYLYNVGIQFVRSTTDQNTPFSSRGQANRLSPVPMGHRQTLPPPHFSWTDKHRVWSFLYGVRYIFKFKVWTVSLQKGTLRIKGLNTLWWTNHKLLLPSKSKNLKKRPVLLMKVI